MSGKVMSERPLPWGKEGAEWMAGARKLRAQIKQLDATQMRVAQLLDVHERSIREWCSGRVPVPKVVGLALAYLIRDKAQK